LPKDSGIREPESHKRKNPLVGKLFKLQQVPTLEPLINTGITLVAGYPVAIPAMGTTNTI
jgi:hypothetical protein